MTKPNVSRLTKEELLAEKAVETSVSTKPSARNRGELYSTEYIRKLSIDEIKAFFEKFDVQTVAKFPNDKDPKFVFANCNGFQVVFSDYSFVFDFNEYQALPEGQTPKFDLDTFANYCSTIEKTPDQVISELMTIELFGQRFPSYSENRRKVKLQENKLAFESLPKSMRKALKTANEQKENEIESTHNKLYFGDYAGNPYQRTDEN